MIQADKILIRHIVSEKAAAASANLNQYTFEVSQNANRTMVEQAVRKALGKSVTKVRIVNVKPKVKANRFRRGQIALSSGYKKAIVSLKAGESIEIA